MCLLRGIQEILQFADGRAQSLGPAEEGDDVADLAVGGEGRALEHVGQHELGVAVLGVFFEQPLQDGAGLGAVALEEVLAVLLEALRALAAGAQRRVEGQVAEQVEGVGFGLAGGLGQLVEVARSRVQVGADSLFADIFRSGQGTQDHGPVRHGFGKRLEEFVDAGQVPANPLGQRDERLDRCCAADSTYFIEEAIISHER